MEIGEIITKGIEIVSDSQPQEGIQLTLFPWQCLFLNQMPSYWHWLVGDVEKMSWTYFSREVGLELLLVHELCQWTQPGNFREKGHIEYLDNSDDL